MYLLAQVGLILTALISPIPQPETTITLTMQMDEVGAAMVGIDAQIVDRTDETIVYGRCTSNDSGLCVMEVNDALIPDLVRGTLDLGSSGTRTFIFEKGKDQSLVIPFTKFGKVIGGVNHEPHPTFEHFNPRAIPTELPPAQGEATQIPTTELVVVDPAGHVTSTPSATEPDVTEVAAIVEIIETGVPVTLVVVDGEVMVETDTETDNRSWIVILVIILLFLLARGIGIVVYWRQTNGG